VLKIALRNALKVVKGLTQADIDQLHNDLVLFQIAARRYAGAAYSARSYAIGGAGLNQTTARDAASPD
jgi:hypothetical protein